MAGIDKITGEILASGRERADEIKKKADADAAAIFAAANEEIRASGEVNAAKIREDGAKALQRAKSQAGLVRRQTLLAARQGLLDEIIEKAYKELSGKPASEYFQMLEGILKKNVRAEKGEMLLGAADLARLPKDFPERVRKIAKEAGGELTLSKEAARLENGFLLRYGGIEENCSLRALFASRQNEMTDAVLAALEHKK